MIYNSFTTSFSQANLYLVLLQIRGSKMNELDEFRLRY